MSGRQGGKAKPLKAPKKQKAELDDTDLEFKEKQKKEAAERKALAEQAGQRGELVLLRMGLFERKPSVMSASCFGGGLVSSLCAHSSKLRTIHQ
ncbi:TMA7-domain-containing protein [Wilcoxina mikolae CBS 423.85]|nr:TMA7-domain-containing protein [Wilcoxina mikolae CBS 423.85]